VLGDLVVLINPAAEAAKWTQIQREVWQRIAFRTDDVTPSELVAAGHQFFPDDQKPVMVSVTAALNFPPGGLRGGDCAWIMLDVDDPFKPQREAIKERLHKNEGMFDNDVKYDWATHDLFPTFKLDFRPIALWADRQTAHIEGHQPPGQSCEQGYRGDAGFLVRLMSLPTRVLSKFARTFPFQNTDQGSSHTIGHLDPPRAAFGTLADKLPSAAPFGTTHELMGVTKPGFEKLHPYATLADASIDCPPANRWLVRARSATPPDQHGMFWDSDLAPTTPGAVGEGKPAAHFVHGFNLAGAAPITRANDPFWNMRAFDNALSRHDGYRLSSFICAMNQLVMDDTTGPVPLAPRVAGPMPK
jgi:hypothetical protein